MVLDHGKASDGEKRFDDFKRQGAEAGPWRRHGVSEVESEVEERGRGAYTCRGPADEDDALHVLCTTLAPKYP